MLRSLLPLALALLQAAPAPPRRPAGWGDFPALLWHSGGAEAVTPRVRSFGGTQLLRGESAEELDAAGLAWLAFNAAGRDALYLEPRDRGRMERRRRFFETRDRRWLVREPCLSAPETRADLASTLDGTLRSLGRAGGLGVSLGDEVSLSESGAPFDGCLSAHCRAAWDAWWPAAAREAGLAPEPVEPYRFSTDATRRALTDGDRGALAGWLLRRRFHQHVVLETLEHLRARCRARAPGRPVGLLGLSGQSAFGNVAVERVVDGLDFLEGYPIGNARELLFTLRTDQRALATVFPARVGPERGAWSVWEHWVRGGDGVVVWSDALLGDAPAAAESTLRAVESVRALADGLGFAPRPAGVALAHSPDSVAASWMRDALLDGPTWPNRRQGLQEREGTLEADRRGWLELLEDAGAMPGALPLGHVDAGTAARFDVLILSHVLVVAREELEGLERYVAAGGRVWVHGELGWIDRAGAAYDPPVLERLRRAAPERVRVVDEAVRRHPAERSPARIARVARDLDAAGVERSPVALPAPGRWLVTWSRSGGAVTVALLPRAPRGGERPELDVPGAELEWLWPRPGEPWRPGDALCVRVRAQ